MAAARQTAGQNGGLSGTLSQQEEKRDKAERTQLSMHRKGNFGNGHGTKTNLYGPVFSGKNSSAMVLLFRCMMKIWLCKSTKVRISKP